MRRLLLCALLVASTPVAVAAPNLAVSSPDVQNAVSSLLYAGRPTIQLTLDAPVGYAYYTDLSRRGDLESYEYSPPKMKPVKRFRLTSRGLDLAKRLSWVKVSDSWWLIPVGSYSIKTIGEPQKAQNGYRVRFQYTGVMNETGRELEKIAPASDWVVRLAYPLACTITLADLGDTRTAVATLVATPGMLQGTYPKSWPAGVDRCTPVPAAPIQ